MLGIVKDFPGVRALDGVDLEVRAGEVHCLVGQNGAGKSTIIKVLAGAHQPDAGSIRWNGEEVRFSSPMAALRHGVATIYQELDLVDGLTVAENIYLGHEISAGGFTRRGTLRANARSLLARLGHSEIPTSREVGRLSAAGKQVVSIARALSYNAQVIVMDEPSAVLAQNEVTNLFRVIRDLTAGGVAVVYISHRLDEVRQIGDRVTVLKDGHTVATALPARTVSTREIVTLMTGRDIEFPFPPRVPTAGGARTEVLRVDGLSRRGEFENVSFAVSAGEIVGIAGLVGSGRSELLETVYGARRPSAGTVSFLGKQLRPGALPRSVAKGMGLAPEERKSQALFMRESIATNMTAASLSRYSRFSFLNRRRELADANKLVRSLDLRPNDARRRVVTLSGGNQQKVVVGRWLMHGCRLLLLDEPTRGVDVGARAELYAIVRQLADSGVAVLLVSSEVPEVLGLADRVLVLRDGRIVHESPAQELDESGVLDLVMEGSAV